MRIYDIHTYIGVTPAPIVTSHEISCSNFVVPEYTFCKGYVTKQGQGFLHLSHLIIVSSSAPKHLNFPPIKDNKSTGGHATLHTP